MLAVIFNANIENWTINDIIDKERDVEIEDDIIEEDDFEEDIEEDSDDEELNVVKTHHENADIFREYK